MQKIRLLLPMLACGLCLACGDNTKEKATPPKLGNKDGAITLAAQKYQINKNSLLVAASISSNFGLDTKYAANLPAANRGSHFSLLTTETPPSADFATSAKQLAEKISTLAKQNRPTQIFDWFVLTAQAIVGKESASSLAQTQMRIVLSELIARYNSGFMARFNDGETIIEPPASKPIKIELLDPTRRKYLETLEPAGDFGTSWQANIAAEVGDKYSSEIPTIILRWCNASALTCFDSLRNSDLVSSHYMAFHNANGSLDFIKLHNNRKDLSWYGAPANNAISVTLTGVLDSFGFEPETFNWSAYISLHKLVKDTLQSFSSSISTGVLNPNLGAYLQYENGLSPALPSLSVPPEGTANFALPKYWDSALFAELLKLPAPNANSTIGMESKKNSFKFKNTHPNFTFNIAKGVSLLQIYSDMSDSSEQGWQLLRKSFLQSKANSYKFDDEFAQPTTPTTVRALRVIARNNAGQPTGLTVFRFLLKKN